MPNSINLLPSSTVSTDGISPLPDNEQLNVNMTTRRSELTLPLELAIPIYTPPQSREDVDATGQILFENFLREEFEQQRVTTQPLLEAGDTPMNFFTLNGNSSPFTVPAFSNTQATSSSVASTPEGYKSHAFVEVGGRIRELADQFASSPERQTVLQHANEVNLNEISKDLFWKFLREIFKNGFTPQRLIALFFFCSDVLIRSARENMREVCSNLFLWSMQYIVENVCKWVHENGGWEKVFSQIWNLAYKTAVFAALVIFIGVGVVYIRKNW